MPKPLSVKFLFGIIALIAHKSQCNQEDTNLTEAGNSNNLSGTGGFQDVSSQFSPAGNQTNPVPSFTPQANANSIFQHPQNSPSDSSSFSETIATNSNGRTCIYQNGLITENGVTRKATPKEVSQLRDYIIGMRQYQDRQFNVMRNQMNAQMSRMFSPGFPFNIPAADAPVAQMPADNVLPIPKAPCLCPSNCNSLVMLSSNLNGL